MNLNASFSGCLAVCSASLATIGRRAKVRPRSTIDLSRYVGPWRILACTDNKLERDFVDAVETYRMGPHGRIDVHFEWREKSFEAPLKTHDFTGQVVADGTNARWKMRLVPLLSASYIIVKVAPDYSRAAVAHPSRKFGWVLARQRTLPEEEFQEMMTALEREGYDLSTFIRVPQVRGQGTSALGQSISR